MRSIVFAIDWDQFGSRFTARPHYQIPAGDQHFLIREAYAFVPANCLIGGIQPVYADDGRHHKPGFRSDRCGYAGLRTSRQFRNGHTLRLQQPAQLPQGVVIRYHCHLRAEFGDLAGQ